MLGAGGAVREEHIVFKNILVPIDLDYPKSAAESLDAAWEIARANGGALTVISILPAVIGDAGEPIGGYRPRLNSFLAEHGSLGEIREIIEVGGSVSAEIRAAARRIGADLIVMGARDAEFTDAMIGSNAAHVVVHSPCSVLLVQ
jgi:nucleotide-binding universal stress UspA family protein